MSLKRSRRVVSSDSGDETYTSEDETVLIPNSDDSGPSDDSDSDSDTDCDEKLPSVTYRRALKNYQVDQVKLEKNHKFQWVNDERILMILKMKYYCVHL